MKFTYNNREIIYSVIKKNRKTISIRIDDQGNVIVSCPLYISDKKVKELVESKAAWISSKLDEIESAKRSRENLTNISFLGRSYKVNIHEIEQDIIKIKLEENTFEVHITNKLKEKREEYIKDSIVRWYRERAKKIFEERIKYYSQKLGVSPNRVSIKDQSTRWGSCSSKGNINLNYRVVMAPMEVIDYLIVHELSHMIHLNHSKDFWLLVESVLPDYKERRAWLKANGNKLKL
jgi:predicted metal-dependent hydrolase